METKGKQKTMRIQNMVLKVAAAVLLWSGTALAGWGDEPGFYYGSHMMGAGYMGWTMLVFWGILLGILFLLLRWVSGLTPAGPVPMTPLDTLKQRLASGDIDIEEFKEKQQLL